MLLSISELCLWLDPIHNNLEYLLDTYNPEGCPWCNIKHIQWNELQSHSHHQPTQRKLTVQRKNRNGFNISSAEPNKTLPMGTNRSLPTCPLLHIKLSLIHTLWDPLNIHSIRFSIIRLQLHLLRNWSGRRAFPTHMARVRISASINSPRLSTCTISRRRGLLAIHHYSNALMCWKCAKSTHWLLVLMINEWVWESRGAVVPLWCCWTVPPFRQGRSLFCSFLSAECCSPLTRQNIPRRARSVMIAIDRRETKIARSTGECQYNRHGRAAASSSVRGCPLIT